MIIMPSLVSYILTLILVIYMDTRQRFWYRRLLLKDSMLLNDVKAQQSGDPGAGDGDYGGNNYRKLMSLMMQLRKWSDFI